MVRISNVWDSTTEVLAGRSGVLATIAFFAFLLPGAAQAAVEAHGGKSPVAMAVAAAVMLGALVFSLWGQLSVIGIASDPAATRAKADKGAIARLPAALLLLLVLIAGAALVALPAIVVLAASGFDWQAAMNGGKQPTLPIGASLFLFVWGLAVAVAALWLYARMFPLLAVLLLERRGIGAIGRSWRLTRGMTWRLLGTALLFVVVYLVAVLAAQAVVFIIARLLLGPALIVVATWIGGLAAAAVGAVFSTVVAVFGARLYAALQARETAAQAAPLTQAP